MKKDIITTILKQIQQKESKDNTFKYSMSFGSGVEINIKMGAN